MTITSPPEQGQLVQVRSRPWVVNDVKPSSLPTPAMKLPAGTPQNLLTLSSVEDDGLGEELQVVWEIEPGAKIVEKVALPGPTGFERYLLKHGLISPAAGRKGILNWLERIKPLEDRSNLVWRVPG
jgi:hypothetical protein